MSQEKNLNILRTKRAFKIKQKVFFIIFKGLSLKLMKQKKFCASDFNHIGSIMSKRYNILPTRTNFFTSRAGKIENFHEFKVKLFEYLLTVI